MGVISAGANRAAQAAKCTARDTQRQMIARKGERPAYQTEGCIAIALPEESCQRPPNGASGKYAASLSLPAYHQRQQYRYNTGGVAD